ncbi:hypothetical protein, partial [Streptomyces sp. NPDC002587]
MSCPPESDAAPSGRALLGGSFRVNGQRGAVRPTPAPDALGEDAAGPGLAPMPATVRRIPRRRPESARRGT